MNINFKYYHRNSGVETWELYRCPDNGQPLFAQNLGDIEKANKLSAWSKAENIQGLREENLSGWFDEENGISKEQAEHILISWGVA